ncbi:MAG: nucleotide exchange factor GrpE [Thermoanaerobacteraceae bacterium]|nr:nucleotide exchange factor GrpE [Thermoanaerobacteraceae bacterium]
MQQPEEQEKSTVHNLENEETKDINEEEKAGKKEVEAGTTEEEDADAGAAAETDTVEESVPEEEQGEECSETKREETGAAEEIGRLKVELEKLVAEKEDLTNRLLRLQADFDNFRKRSRKEQEEFAKYASQNLIEKLLPVLDNFGRALEAGDDNARSFKDGVEMIYKQLLGILEQEGLKPIEAENQPFDPNFHEAVMQVETDEYPDNTVVEELQKGYRLKNKVIRPAMVKVAKNN